MESVASQKGVSLEYIVIDGNSTDGSIDLIRYYAKHLRYWTSEKDSGQSQALNKGLRIATGEIVGWLCSDDLLLPGALKQVVEFFKKNPEIDIVTADALVIDEDGLLVKSKKEIPFRSKIALNSFNYVAQPSTFWRRRLHERLGYLREDLHLTMDFEFWLRLEKAGAKFKHTNQYWSCMRKHRNQKVATQVDRAVYEMALLASEYESKILRDIPRFMRLVGARAIRTSQKLARGSYWANSAQHLSSISNNKPVITKESVRQQIIFVEPIFRGSRLQVLANALGSLDEDVEKIIVTRRDYLSDHFQELIVSKFTGIKIRPFDSDLDGAWIKNLDKCEFRLMINEVASVVHERRDRATTIIFMALDDYLKSFLRDIRAVTNAIKGQRVLIFKYRVEYLLKLDPQRRLRDLALRIATTLAYRLTRAKFVVFDERLIAKNPNSRFWLLPDPWFGEFSENLGKGGREALNINQDAEVILSLGRQDKRKGIDFLIEAGSIIFRNPATILLIVGRIDEAYREDFEVLKTAHFGRLIHIDRFVDEAELPMLFASASIFLMAYDRDFTATSGTLARAAASGVPILSTDHGLVGHRVKELGLGLTFKAHDLNSFASALSGMLGASNECKKIYQRNCGVFASTCTIGRFESSFRSVLERN